MKYTQLFLKFTQKVRRHLQLLPSPAASSPVAPKGNVREPVLEELCRGLLKAAGCRSLEVGVYWNNRLRTTAGLACWRRKAIFLNPRLRDVSQKEVQRTLRHELAHFLAQHRVGRRRIAAHGAEWKQACRDLGIPGESRCHDLPFKRVRLARRHFYACRECGSSLARVRPLRRPVACIKCCRRHNGGKYHDNFRYISAPAPEHLAA